MDVLLQQVLNGLTLGGIYGLVALGLTLVYGILHVPNFAHGAFYMVGAFVAFHAMNAWGLGYWLAMLVAAGVVAAMAVVSERLVFTPLRNASGWYEEDCESNIVGMYHPEAFPHYKDGDEVLNGTNPLTSSADSAPVTAG